MERHGLLGRRHALCPRPLVRLLVRFRGRERGRGRKHQRGSLRHPRAVRHGFRFHDMEKTGRSARPCRFNSVRRRVDFPHAAPGRTRRFYEATGVSSSKLRRSSSTTSGLPSTLVLIERIYSPIRPIKNSWTPPRKNCPITSGAMPAWNQSQ